jgi:hypothetical protein
MPFPARCAIDCHVSGACRVKVDQVVRYRIRFVLAHLPERLRAFTLPMDVRHL